MEAKRGRSLVAPQEVRTERSFNYSPFPAGGKRQSYNTWKVSVAKTSCKQGYFSFLTRFDELLRPSCLFSPSPPPYSFTSSPRNVIQSFRCPFRCSVFVSLSSSLSLIFRNSSFIIFPVFVVCCAECLTFSSPAF